MENNPVIDGGGGSNSFIRNFYSIGGTQVSADNIYASSISSPVLGYPPDLAINATSNVNFTVGGSVRINGTPITNASAWSVYPATQSVNFSNFNITNLANLNGTAVSNYLTTTTGVTNPVTATLNLNNNAITNVLSLNGTLISNYLTTTTGVTNPVTATLNLGNNAITNVGSIGVTGGNVNMGGGVISNVAAISSTTGLQLNSPSGVTINNQLSMATYSITNCPSISSLTNLALAPASGYAVNISGPVNMGSNNISNVGGFTRILGGSAVAQPVTQYGSTSGTGNNGSVVVTIPNYYTSASSYNVFITHVNSSPANTSVVKTSGLQFTIYWTNAGGGTQPFDWMAIGT
jgi:hypothetical protein